MNVSAACRRRGSQNGSLSASSKIAAPKEAPRTVGTPMVEAQTLAEARDLGWRITARCAWGRREGLKSIRECKASIVLDLDTLIWTRGAAFPISMLEGRLKCPRCESRRVVLLFDLPGAPLSRRSLNIERAAAPYLRAALTVHGLGG